MKQEFGEALDLRIYTNDSPEALKFVIRGSTSVFVAGDRVPLDVALSRERMKAFLQEKM